MSNTKDNDSIQSSFMEAVEESYFNPDPDDASARVTGGRRHKTLVQVASEFDINPQKVKKILVTAKAIDTEQSRRIQQLAASGLTVKQIAEEEQISESAVKSYLPYSRVIYSMDDATKEAIKQREVRKEKQEEIQRMNGMMGYDFGVENIDEGAEVDSDGYFTHNSLPFKPTQNESGAASTMAYMLGSSGAMCVYGDTGCGKSRLFGYFIREVHAGRIEIEGWNSENIYFHTISASPLMTVNDLIPEMGRLIGLELKRGMKEREKLVKELVRRTKEGLLDCYLFDDIRAYSKTNMNLLVEIMRMNKDTGIPILMNALPPVDESIEFNQGRRLVEKDQNWELLKGVMFYRLDGMNKNEALEWIKKVEDMYDLRIELPAQWELLAINEHSEVGGMANMVQVVEDVLYHLCRDKFRVKDRAIIPEEQKTPAQKHLDEICEKLDKEKRERGRVSTDPDGKIRVPREFIVEMCKDKMVL